MHTQSFCLNIGKHGPILITDAKKTLYVVYFYNKKRVLKYGTIRPFHPIATPLIVTV